MTEEELEGVIMAFAMGIPCEWQIKDGKQWDPCVINWGPKGMRYAVEKYGCKFRVKPTK